MRRELTWVMTWLAFAAISHVPVAEGANDLTPKSVQAAVAKHDRSVQQAMEEYRKKATDARAKLITEIDNTVKDLAKRGDQEEMARLIEYKKNLPPVEDDSKGAFSVKQIVNRPMYFFKITQAFGRLTLLQDGTIESTYKSVNEKTWRITKEGSMQFLNGTGQVTSEYKDCMRSGSNLFLWGPFLADGSLLGMTTIEPEPAK
jgi:hypothetical protein